MPPSTTARPPTQTAHCVPRRSSRLILGAMGAGCGGGAMGTAMGGSRSGSAGASFDGVSGSGTEVVGSAAGGIGSCVGGAGAGGMAAAMPRSSATSRASTRRKCSPSPTDFTKATMAMIGNASSSNASRTKNKSIPNPTPATASDAIQATMRAKASRGARAQTQPRRRALLHHLAAEAEQRRRPPPGRGRGLAGRLDQGRRLNQAAEVLLVQVAPRDRLHGALQLREGELARHQLEYDRTVFELGAQPRDGGGEDAAVIEAHRLSQPGHGLPCQRGLAAVAARFLHQAGLVEEFVAVERLLLVPRAAAEREARAHALAAAQRARGRGLGGAARPILEQRQDDLVEDLRPLIAPIFPREEAIPWFESGAGRAQSGEILRHAREREITDRDHVGAGIARPRVAAAIAEGVKLLHIADRKAGLRLDPRPQPDFEGAVRERIERPERQPRARLARGAVAGHENGGLLVLHRDDRGGEPDLDRRERGVGHGGSVASALDVARVNMPSNGPRRACL